MGCSNKRKPSESAARWVNNGEPMRNPNETNKKVFFSVKQQRTLTTGTPFFRVTGLVKEGLQHVGRRLRGFRVGHTWPLGVSCAVLHST